MGQLTPGILALGRLSQECGYKFKPSLGYLMNSILAGLVYLKLGERGGGRGEEEEEEEWR